MKVELTQLFVIYLFVFLAVILMAWLFFSWQHRRTKLRRYFVCGICNEKIFAEAPKVRIRCPHCGARRKTNSLKEIVYGNVDWKKS